MNIDEIERLVERHEKAAEAASFTPDTRTLQEFYHLRDKLNRVLRSAAPEVLRRVREADRMEQALREMLKEMVVIREEDGDVFGVCRYCRLWGPVPGEHELHHDGCPVPAARTALETIALRA